MDGSPFPGASSDAGAALVRTTEVLVRRAKGGDQDAFGMLHALHAEPVARSVARRLGRHLSRLVDLEDILQETFVTAWQYLDADRFCDFETLGGFRSFLVKVAIQKIQDAGRRAATLKRSIDRVERAIDCETTFPSNEPRPSQDARAQELEELREVALLQLDAERRWLIDARDNLGLSWDEMARELGCRPANAKLRYFRARDRWRAAWRSLYGDGDEPPP